MIGVVGIMLKGIDRSPGLYDPGLEAMSAERRQAYQADRLQAAVTHAYVHSPNFRRRMDAAGLTPAAMMGIKDLNPLPVLKKSNLPHIKKQEPPFGGLLAAPLAEVSRIYQ